MTPSGDSPLLERTFARSRRREERQRRSDPGWSDYPTRRPDPATGRGVVGRAIVPGPCDTLGAAPSPVRERVGVRARPPPETPVPSPCPSPAGRGNPRLACWDPWPRPAGVMLDASRTGRGEIGSAPASSARSRSPSPVRWRSSSCPTLRTSSGGRS